MRGAAFAAMLAVAHGSTAFAGYSDRTPSGREDTGGNPSGRGLGGVVDWRSRGISIPTTTLFGVFSTPGGNSASVAAGRGSATTGGGGWGPHSSRETSGDY